MNNNDILLASKQEEGYNQISQKMSLRYVHVQRII